MALTHGPLVFFTDGTDISLAALTNVASFASAVNWRLQVLHMLDEDGQATRAERIASTLAALPAQAEPPSVLAVRRSALPDALTEGSVERTGVLALHLEQRRFLNHIMPDNAYNLLPYGWNPPVLMVPATARRRTIRRVLFPADLALRSIAAFDEAIALCETLGAELHVLHVFGDDQRLPMDKDMSRRLAARNPRELLDIDRNALRAMVERASTRGIRALASTAEGRAYTHILGYAATSEVDLILMPTHGPRNIEDIMLGTTTARVVRGASVPVMSLRSSAVHGGVSTAA